MALALLGDSYLYAVLPIYHAEAGISLVAVGWALSVNRWIRFASNPVAGLVGRRLGWGWAFAGAMWLGTLTTAGYGLLTGALAFYAMRGLWGVSWSFLRLGGMAAVLADTPPGRRGKAVGLFTGIFRLGSLAGVAVGGWLADRLGFREAALLLAGATAVGALLSSLPSALQGWNGRSTSEAEKPATHSVAANWLPVTPMEWRVSLGAFAVHLAVSGVVTGTLGLLVKERLGMQIDLGWWVVGASTLSGIIMGSRFLLDLAVGPVIGHLADSQGRGRLLAALGMTSIAALLGLGWTSSLIALALSALVLFLAGTGLATVFDSWASDLAGRAPGRFLPAYNTWQDLGAAVGPVLAYNLTARVGLAATYTAVAVAGALGALWFQRYSGQR